MKLAAGSKLSFYEVLGPLGAGAMGEVWRARDTRLDREVALKVLPEHFADDEERLKRFEREARALAALNHPNVAQIHGVDQVEDTCFLVLELVPGEALEERLRRGPLPLEEALDVCRQIAEGLEAAHEAGVIHRDLKPANVRLTPEGKVKVLDFGLAKPAGDGQRGSSTDSVLSTEAGRLLGTPTYMAPEQARGKSIDKRVDIWAFGCVLYECLTARRAFEGETLGDVLGAVLHTQVELAALPVDTPEEVRGLLARCLQKDPRRRLRDIGEARLGLESALAAPSAARTRPAGRGTAGALRYAPWALSLGLGALALFLATRAPAARDSASETIGYRFTLPRARDGASFPVLSPDGRFVVSAAQDGLWLRALDERQARLLEGTGGGRNPFWAPDSRQIGFFADGALKRVTTRGAPPETLATCPPGWLVATWSSDGSILIDLTESLEEEGWYLVEPGARSARKIRAFPRDRAVGPDKAFPCFLPDGRHFLFTQPHEGQPWLQLGSLDSEETRLLTVAGSRAQYVEPGYVLYVREGVLLAHAFDTATLSLQGEPRELERGVSFFAPTGSAEFTVSQQGTLVFERFGRGAGLKWFDRAGRELETLLPSGQHVEDPALSPDGRRLVYGLREERDGTSDLWLLDLERRVPSRLTSAARGEYLPRWDPSGQRIAFSADWKGPPSLYLLDVAGGEPSELVPFDRRVQNVGSWTPDGKAVLYSANSGARNADLWIVDTGSLERRSFLSSEFSESQPRVSPDGKLVAFVSDVSGRSEVYLVPFAGGDRLRLSSDGGFRPEWSADGKELVFQSHDETLLSIALEVEADGRVRAEQPEPLMRFARGTLVDWLVTPDGQRFLIAALEPEDVSVADEVLVDWPRLLTR